MSAQQVESLLEFIGYSLNREEARKFLQNNNNDVEQAASKFYDQGEDAIRRQLKEPASTWDDSAFGADRYGDGAAGVPTFAINYAPGHENYPHSGVQSRAPTRPPSRTSQRSVLSTHMGDAPMQSIETTQESGIVGSTSPAFGPATREHYDTAQWAMVTTATEYIPDPDPAQRGRDREQPAFLKPSPNYNYLPAVIAILHSIPLFRNMLLSPGVEQRNYDAGESWWKGSPVIKTRVMDISAGPNEANGLDIIFEAQRLMAFLDGTDRAYATVSSLLQLDGWKESQPQGLEDPDDDVLRFLLIWSSAYQRQVPDAGLNGNIRSVVNAAGNSVENFVLDANVGRSDSRTDLTLYDVLDDALFSSIGGSAHILDISNVLILRLTSNRQDTSDLGCQIPAILYAARYMEKNRHVIESMYKEIQQYEDQVTKIDTQVQKIKYHTPKKGKRVESLKLLETSMKAFQAPDEDSEMNPTDAKVLLQLQDLHKSIRDKLSALEQQSNNIRKTLNTISSRFKPPIEDPVSDADTMDLTTITYPAGQTPQDAMQDPYHLCGVATRRDVIYLLHPDASALVPSGRRWWRTQFDSESSTPIILRDRVSQQDVIERATSESASALLIYANPAALAEPEISLTNALQNFVLRDNETYKEECAADLNMAWQDYEDGNLAPRGNWDETPSYHARDDWATMSAREFAASQARHAYESGSGVGQSTFDADNFSSTTLTPDTEVGDDMGLGAAVGAGVAGGVREMVEINGGMDVAMGLGSRASSDTIGVGVGSREGDGDWSGVLNGGDEEMRDRDAGAVRHVEMVEKKGG